MIEDDGDDRWAIEFSLASESAGQATPASAPAQRTTKCLTNLERRGFGWENAGWTEEMRADRLRRNADEPTPETAPGDWVGYKNINATSQAKRPKELSDARSPTLVGLENRRSGRESNNLLRAMQTIFLRIFPWIQRPPRPWRMVENDRIIYRKGIGRLHGLLFRTPRLPPAVRKGHGVDFAIMLLQSPFVPAA